MKQISLRNIHAVDVHAHPYVANEQPYTPETFIRKLSLSVQPEQMHSGQVTSPLQPFPGSIMWMQILIRRLARYYSCEPTLAAVVNERNKRAANFQDYTRELFADAKLTGLITDFGYPTPMLEKQDYAQLCGATIWEIHRIESVMVRLRKESGSFGEFIEKYRTDLRNALQRDEIVGLKSIIAYRSGLEVQDKNEQAAALQWVEFLSDERAEAKALRDFCLHIAMEECTLADKVMHIHTGVGDGDVILPKASPSFLLSLLRTKAYAETKVHLVHGGYPWVEEAAFIVSILPNVYMDISLQNPFVGHGVKRILSQVFEFAPFDKVMYGSDAFTVPEMNWLGVHLFKECFEQVLQDWVDSDYLDTDTAQYVGEMVLYRNFESVYLK